MKQFKSEIRNLAEVAEDYYRLDFSWDADIIPKAGQFLTIRVTDLSSPLLRRPFALSSHNREKREASIIFQKIGNGTELLSRMKKGDIIDILAPLGNSFSEKVSADDQRKKRHVVVAGGIGTGPMLYLADELRAEGKSPLLIIGCRNKSLVPFPALDDSIETAICTDDGSWGFRGNVVDFMKSREDIDGDSVIYSCGPGSMLKGCHGFASEKGISAYVSLEEVMACGVGACMGCTCEIEGDRKYARVCKDGPVFASGEVKWT